MAECTHGSLIWASLDGMTSHSKPLISLANFRYVLYPPVSFVAVSVTHEDGLCLAVSASYQRRQAFFEIPASA
ncbi:MAG: hypothetical protein ACI9YU_002001 [Flavobacteriales bacterium]|jgi:hypothetical protein